MQDLHQRLYKVKTTLFAVVLAVVGLGILFLSHNVEQTGSPTWLTFWPLSELGSTLFITGLVVVAMDYWDGKDKEARDTERLRNVLHSEAPAIRDAVIQGFALGGDDLRRVATPELLDHLAENTLALRFGDPTFAREVYEDLLTQAISAAERWYDVQISVRFSPAGERDAGSVPLFDLLVTWDYTTVPSHRVRRFACVSDRDEYQSLTSERPSTSAWLMAPSSGLDATAQANFELLDFRVDGEPRPIRRAATKTGQIYSVDLGRDLVEAAEHEPVRIRHTYRVRLCKAGHRLFVEVVQPSRGVSVDVDYSDTDISNMSVTELVSTSRRPSVMRLPGATGARQVSIETSGWLLPRAGFAFVWTLSSEAQEPLVPAARTDAADSAAPGLPTRRHRS